MLRIMLLFLLVAGSLYADADVKTDVTVFEDKSGSMGIDKVVDHGTFVPFERARHNHSGVTRSAFWMKVELHNDTDQLQKRVFSFKNLFMADIELYDAASHLRNRYGKHVPFANNDYPFSKVAIAMDVDAGSSSVYYLRIVSSISMNLSHLIRSEAEFLPYMAQMLSFYAFYYGGIVVLIVYNFIFFLYSRKIEFLYYVFFAFVMMRIMLANNGIAAQFLWPEHPQLNGILLDSTIVLLGIFGIMFVRAFFHTDTRSPRLHRFLRYVIYFDILMLGIIQIDAIQHSELRIIIFITMFVSLFIMFASTLYLYLHSKHRAALIMLLGWGVLLGGMIVSYLGHLDIIESNFFVKNSFQIASFAELLIFSLALAYSYKESHDDLEQKKIQIRAINKNLEAIIEEKTGELVEEVRYKENLLKELSHRVKNSLQVVSGFISLQSKYCDDARVKSLLADSNLRIRAMSNIHERLVNQESADYVDMQGYVQTLLEENRQIHGFTRLDFVVKTDNTRLLIDQATTVGLIVNEAVSNALKHAFKNIKNPKIEIDLRALDAQMLELQIQDNGNGVADGNVDKQTSLGHKIIASLADQLRADLQTDTDKGFCYILRFQRSL